MKSSVRRSCLAGENGFNSDFVTRKCACKMPINKIRPRRTKRSSLFGLAVFFNNFDIVKIQVVFK